jgi:hypothetical protein
MTLQEAVFKGLVDPGTIVSVREILTSTTPDTDTALFSAAAATYTVTPNDDGSFTVDSNGGADGIDTVRNVERLQFSDTTLILAVPAAPVITSLVPGNASVTVNFTGPASATSFTVRAFLGTNTTVAPVRTLTVTASPAVITGLTNGSLYTFTVTAANLSGTSPAASGTATPVAPTVPGAPTGVSAVAGNASATVSWTPPASNGGSAITGFVVRVVNAGGNQVGALRPAGAAATSLVVNGLNNGQPVRFQVAATNAVGTSAFSALSAAVTPATVPGAPTIGTAQQGAPGGAITATARWTAPANNGGSIITGYRVTALRLSAAGAVLQTTVSAVQPAGATSLSMTLPVAGNYRFTVQAINAIGAGAQSARSNLVAGR